MINLKQMTNGSSVAMGVVEITSVPHISILESEFSSKSEESMNVQYKRKTEELLSQLHQYCIMTGNTENCAFELLWLTQSVDNQTFKSKIRLFVITRIIGTDENQLVQKVSHVCEIVRSTLVKLRYDAECVDCDDFQNIVSSVSDTKINALLKQENVINLQNQMLPVCFYSERISSTAFSLEGVANTLTNYPNSAVSFQLITTKFSVAENASVEQMSQILSSLNEGVNELGHIGIKAAKKPAEIFNYYNSESSGPVFLFSALVYGDENSCDDIAAALYAQLIGEENDKNRLQYVEISNSIADTKNNLYPLPWAVSEHLIATRRNYAIWNNPMFRNLFRLPFMVTAKEASEFFRFPIADDNLSVGFNIIWSDKRNRVYRDNVLNYEKNLKIGKLRASTDFDIGVDINDLTKHSLVVGTPGSGKTTFLVSVLDRLWKDFNIPFLVIEPAKNEYRALIKSIPDLQVFTPGKNLISPFVFNPFVPPKNVKLESYKSTLKTAFEAGVSMSTPLDKIFEESVNNCYSDFRWLDTYTVESGAKIFNISDFIKCFETTFDEIGYTGDAKNIGRAGVVRLKSLVNLFDHYFSVPIEDILSKPTVIELAAVENIEDKALIIALLFLSIFSYTNANLLGDGKLKNVILLEEAHVLLDADTNVGEGNANPSAVAQRLVKRILAEFRSYGIGMLIADQSPQKVGSDIVALTDVKVAFRLVETGDKQMVADSTGMSDMQMSRLSKLRPGEAFLFFNRLDEPEEVVVSDYRLENNIEISLTDDSLRQLATYWIGKEKNLRPYPECSEVSCCFETCDYCRRVLAKEISRRIFMKYMNRDKNNIDVFKRVYYNLKDLIIKELNFEEYSEELLYCVRVHFLRKVKYSTKIQINEETLVRLLLKKF